MPRKIAIISDHASPLAVAGGNDTGGQNIYVANIARHIHAMGYTLDVFTRRDNPTLPDVVEWKKGLRIVHVPAGPPAPLRKESMLPVMPEFAERIAEFSREHGGYDLVHANFFMSGMVALRLKHLFGTPFAITFHALGRVRRLYQRDADQFPDERIDIEDRTVEHADAIIAECPQDCVDLISFYNAEREKIRIIPCGFDAREFWPVTRTFARRLLGFGKDERIVLHVGRIVPRKGIDNLIRALGRLSRAGIKATLVVVGGNSDSPDFAATPEIGRLEKIAREEGILDQTLFTGRRSREVLKLYYSAADVFVTTPWYEPFGITPLEAMACGTPVVGSAVGGIKHSVVDGTTGFLVPPNDPDALAGRLAHLYRNPMLLGKFGYNSLQRVNAKFTWERVAKSIAALYDEVVPSRTAAFTRGKSRTSTTHVYRQPSGMPAR
jgi:glycosyltransferase involved in cell wall biosynthesis